MTKKFTPLTIALMITVAVALGGTMLAISNSQDTRSGARGRPADLPIADVDRGRPTDLPFADVDNGRPADLSIPEVAEEKINEGLAKMEQVVGNIERHNALRDREQDQARDQFGFEMRDQARDRARDREIAALAKELKKDQENLEYLLAAVGVSGNDTSGYRPDFEQILFRADNALTEAMSNANAEAQGAISEALRNARAGISNIID